MLFMYTHACTRTHIDACMYFLCVYMSVYVYSVCVLVHICKSLNHPWPSHRPDGHPGFEVLCGKPGGSLSPCGKRRNGSHGAFQGCPGLPGANHHFTDHFCVFQNGKSNQHFVVKNVLDGKSRLMVPNFCQL